MLATGEGTGFREGYNRLFDSTMWNKKAAYNRSRTFIAGNDCVHEKRLHNDNNTGKTRKDMEA